MGESIDDMIKRINSAPKHPGGLQVRKCLIIMFPHSSIAVTPSDSEMSGCMIVQSDMLEFEIPEHYVPLETEQER